ncbi:MAG: TraB/GumN family protein [Planctomycetota bacterium]
MRNLSTFRRQCVPVLLAFLLLHVAAFPQEAAKDGQAGPCFLWKATAGAGTVYLLGSFHVTPKDFYPLPAAMEEAFKAAKFLVVECNVKNLDQEKAQKLMEEKGALPGDETLSKKLSKETLKTLEDYCTQNGVPLAAFEKLKPWVVNMTVQILEIHKLGYDEKLGIDLHFLDEAGDKQILELESPEAQIQLMAGFSDDLQEKILKQSLEDLAEVKVDINTAFKAWKKGDAAAMEEVVLAKNLRKHPELKPVFTAMLDERNLKMLEKIEGYLKGPDTYFVVIGAGHLLGAKGLLNLLKQKGCKVEQMQTAKGPGQ